MLLQEASGGGPGSGPVPPADVDGAGAGGGGEERGLLPLPLDMNRLIRSLEYSSKLPSERSDASDMASKRC